MQRIDYARVLLAATDSSEDPAAGNEELGPRKRFGPGEVLKQPGIPLGRVVVSEFQRHLDRVWIEQ